MPDDNDNPPAELPLYRRIQAEIRRRIASGDLKPGQAIPSRNALTAEFGTTRVTLDKAIQQLVDEGVLMSAKGSGTYVSIPGGAPQWPLRRKAMRVGIVLGLQTPPTLEPRDNDVDLIFFGPVFRGISDALAGKPVDISYLHVPVSECLNLSRANNLDGLLLVTPSIEDLPAMLRLYEAGVPFVALSISSTAPEHTHLPCVDAANRAGGYAAARHLIDLGHRRLACVNLATSHANHRDRMYGFRDALIEAGLPHGDDAFVLHDRYATEHFDEIVGNWLDRAIDKGTMPTAIFTCDFTMTLKTLSALRQRGIDVPSRMSLVGFDDPSMSEHLTPPLTTVRQPTYAIGNRAACRLLDGLLGPRSIEGYESLPVELVVRSSTTAI